MKKIISLLMVLAIIPIILAWNPTITINSIEYKPSPFESIFGAYSTGSQLFSNITVSNPNGFEEIKRTQLEWDTSSVGCVRKEVGSTYINYECTLTVTPFMNKTTDVYIVTYSDYGDNYSVILGTYNFNGKPFSTSSPSSTTSSTKINFRGKEANFLEILDTEKGISKISFSFTLNNETKYQPTSIAHGSLTLTTTNKDRISLNLRKNGDISIENNVTTINFEDISIKYRERIETCKTYPNGRVRCKNNYITHTLEDDIKVTMDFNNKEVNLTSESLKINGITGKVVECTKLLNGRTECKSMNW